MLKVGSWVQEKQCSQGKYHLSKPFNIARRGNPRRALASEFDLLGKCKGVLDLDAEVLDGTLDLGVTEKQLDRS
jgi:hypothetical protein